MKSKRSLLIGILIVTACAVWWLHPGNDSTNALSGNQRRAAAAPTAQNRVNPAAVQSTKASSALQPQQRYSRAVAARNFAAQPEAPISETAYRQIAALELEKSRRTPAQQKLDSRLIYAAKMRRGLPVAEGVATQQVELDNDPQGRVMLDIKADVTAALLDSIRALGGNVVNHFAQFQAIRAALPLEAVERLAARADVRFVRPAVRARRFNSNPQGDVVHQAATGRANFSVDGSGIKVGVLSDSVDHLATVQALGDLPAVTVLAGQSGVPGSGEGTAMLEIVHTLAPGAPLYFATAYNSEASFAQNILDLASAGCRVIVDDVGYFDESPFQNGVIAQAVNTVAQAGVLYFSAAGNSGNLDSGTASTWEGDFASGGAVGLPISGTGALQNFGANNYNTITSGGGSEPVLFWSDPIGASTNDYDFYLLNSAGTAVVSSSTTTQNGSQDPYEQLAVPTTGQRLVVVKATGAAARFLHLDAQENYLATATRGNIRGHSAAAKGFGVAAACACNAYPAPFSGGAGNPVENFSSDGPRRMFYNDNGTAITPGNVSATGGTVLAQPLVTAADGVTTSVTGFAPFYGTSAAAPHAAAIAALLLSYNPGLTLNQVSNLLASTALDIMGAGFDANAGHGIVMAQAALAAAPGATLPVFTLAPTARTISAGGTAVFKAQAAGAAPLGYFWVKDSVPLTDSASISGAQTPTLIVSPALLASGGLYAAVATNAYGSVTSSVAALTIGTPADTVPPSLSMVSPSNLAEFTTSPVTVSGKASDDVALQGVVYAVNDGPWRLAVGTTSWSVPTALFAGTNTVTLQSVDSSGNTSTLLTRKYFLRVASPLSVSITGSGSFTPNLNGSNLYVGRNYLLTAIPGTGMLLGNWTASVNHGPTNFASVALAYQFTMQPNLTLIANFVTNRFFAAAGTYHALFSESTGVELESAGYLKLAVKSQSGLPGTFSGKLYLDGDTLSASGSFNVVGDASTTVSRTKQGKLDVNLALHLDLASGNSITGAVSSGSWNATLAGDRATFNAVTNPATTYAGKYTLVLPGRPGSTNEPAGDSYATVTVGSDGSIKASGALAEGVGAKAVAFKPLAVSVSKDGAWPLFAVAYPSKILVGSSLINENQGAVIGWLYFNGNNHAPTGKLDWVKLPWTNQFYPAGFALTNDVMGSRYTPPTPGVRAVAITNGNATLADGNLSLLLNNSFTLSTNNMFGFLPPNVITQKVSVTTSSGLIKASFAHPNHGNAITLTPGVVLQDQGVVRGFFLGTNQSGSLILTNTP